RLTAQQHHVELVLDAVGLHRGRILQRDIAVRALDDETGGAKFARAFGPHQESDIAPGLQHSSAEIAADRAGADHENAHCSLSCLPQFHLVMPGLAAFAKVTAAECTCGPAKL